MRHKTKEDEFIYEAKIADADGRPQDAYSNALKAVDIVLSRKPPHTIHDGHICAHAGRICHNADAFKDADRCFSAALKIFSTFVEPNETSETVAAVYLGLAHAKKDVGQFDAAEHYYNQAIDMMHAVFRIRPDTRGAEAEALMGLGALMMERSLYGKAEAAFLAAERMGYTLQPPHSARVLGKALACLAVLYTALGDYERAKNKCVGALTYKRQILNGPTLALSGTLETLGIIYRRMGKTDEALKIYRDLLSIRSEIFGENDARLARLHHLMASALLDQGDTDAAFEHAKKSVLYIMDERNDVTAHDAGHVNNLGWIEMIRGDYRAARHHLLYTKKLYESTLQSRGSGLANVLCSLALLELLDGHIDQALLYAREGNAAYEGIIRLMPYYGTEMQRLLFMKSIAGKTDLVVELHHKYAPNNQRAAELALDVILQRKGRILDLISHHLEARASTTDEATRKCMEEFKKTKSRLAQLALQNGYEEEIHQLSRHADRLENEINRRSNVRVGQPPINVRAVRPLLPKQTALIEFYFYRKSNLSVPPSRKSTIPSRCAVYVLASDGPIFSYDAGMESVLNEHVSALRQAIQSQEPNRFDDAANKLFDALLKPAFSAFPEIKHWLIAPDGILHFVPFSALISENGQYVLQQAEVSYLSSGRDLLNMQNRKIESCAPPVAYVNPSFGPIDAQEQQHMVFTPLPGTRQEANGIKGILPNMRIISGAEATESRIKQDQHPEILHVATHGFFLGADAMTPNSRGLKKIKQEVYVEPAEAKDWQQEIYAGNPLIRSGLAFADANRPARIDEQDDGLLTALEITEMPLRGTRLVVLSACDTGMGDILNGSGVFGMRRAFVLAGAESLVMSLWPVHDQATAELMTAYYQHLVSGSGRSLALRKAQMEIRSNPIYSSPVYWAAFIVSGQWKPLY